MVLWAVAGALHVETVVRGKLELVRLPEAKIENRRPRFSGLYGLPDDPRLPGNLRGDAVRVRYDTTGDDRRREFNRAENLRPIAIGDPRWSQVSSQRPAAESLNEALKRRWPNKRAPGVGKERQQMHAIYWAMLTNAKARLRHEARTGLDPGGTPQALAA